MTTVHETLGHEEQQLAAVTLSGPPLTLAEEHALPLSQVAIRAAGLRTTEGRCRPSRPPGQRKEAEPWQRLASLTAR